MRFMKRRRVSDRAAWGEDPLSGVANLFDLALVMVVGIMLALLSAFRLADVFRPDTQITIFKRDARGRVSIIVKKGKEIKAYRATGRIAQGEEGERIGVAYRLKDGRIVYVPE